VRSRLEHWPENSFTIPSPEAVLIIELGKSAVLLVKIIQ